MMSASQFYNPSSFRRFTGNRDFDLSEHYSLNRQLARCRAGPGDWGTCVSVDGNCVKCKLRKKDR